MSQNSKLYGLNPDLELLSWVGYWVLYPLGIWLYPLGIWSYPLDKLGIANNS